MFLVSLLEPGAPLVLGLRRTLAFQVVDAVRQSEDWGAQASLALVAGSNQVLWAGS